MKTLYVTLIYKGTTVYLPLLFSGVQCLVIFGGIVYVALIYSRGDNIYIHFLWQGDFSGGTKCHSAFFRACYVALFFRSNICHTTTCFPRALFVGMIYRALYFFREHSVWHCHFQEGHCYSQ